MLPNIDPKQMEKIAKKMGMQMESVPATEVIIKTEEKDIVIKNPQVSKIKMKGQETFQISGDILEKEGVKEEDIELIVQKTGVPKEKAEELLKETGDIALAIKKAQK